LSFESVLTRIKSWIGAALRDADFSQSVRCLKVVGYSNTSEERELADLLSDVIYTKRRVLKINDKTKVIDSSSAYAEITAAYHDFRDDIASAAQIVENEIVQVR
jgi:hypothetical protein